MNLFGLVRITWLPGEKRSRAEVRLSAHLPSETGSPQVAGPPPPPDPPEPPGPPRTPDRPGDSGPAEPLDPDVVQSLIGLADDLAELSGRDWTGDSAARTLRLIQWRVDKVLAQSGVQVLLDEGPVVPARHEVVGAEQSSADGRAGWIAATVRRGYLQGGQLIRPQQVVAYVTAGPAVTPEGDHDAGRG